MVRAYFAPVTNATFPVRSGMSREGSYVGLENKKPMVMMQQQQMMICKEDTQNFELSTATLRLRKDFQSSGTSQLECRVVNIYINSTARHLSIQGAIIFAILVMKSSTSGLNKEDIR